MTQTQKTEAISRMAQLTERFDLNTNLTQYLEEDKVYYSYVVSELFGCVDTITYDERYHKICKYFEKMHNAYVYHAVESITAIGTFLTLLFVSNNENEWEQERLTSDRILACSVIVEDYPEDIGDIGDIRLTSHNGALIRNG